MGDQAPPLPSGWTSVAGLEMRAQVSSPPLEGARPTVVLVHGLISSRYLLPTVRRLAPWCRLLVPDLPGFGRSDRPARALGIAGLADALATFMVSCEAVGAAVVGHSVGAQVAVELANRHPSLVGRTALIGPVVDTTDRRLVAQYRRWLANAAQEPVALHGIAVREVFEVGPRRMLETFRHALGYPIEDKLATVAGPVLLMRGARDRMAPQRWLDELHERLPASDVVVIPGAAHTVVYSAPVAVAQVVRDFSAVSDAPA